MLEIMNEWAEYEFRDIHDEARRAEICGVSPEDVRKGVKALVLKNPCEATFKAAQERYDKGHWPRLYFTNKGKGGMRLKRYLDSMDGKMPTNLWPYSEVGHTDEAKKQLKTLFNDSAPFDTPKPTRLMKRMLDIASDKNSLVLDFFSGSATMGEASSRKMPMIRDSVNSSLFSCLKRQQANTRPSRKSARNASAVPARKSSPRLKRRMRN